MKNRLKKYFKKIIFFRKLSKWKNQNQVNFQKTYSQCGEDRIVKHIFDAIGIHQPTYLDIGAYHPYHLNNTALFYQNGSRGINIEPNEALLHQFLIERKNDVNLNIGIGSEEKILDFYCISSATLNTFSKTIADSYFNEGYNIIKIKKIQVKTLGFVLEKFHKGVFPHFLSLDVEGLEDIIIKQIDFKKNYPIVICVETISFSTKRQGKKNENLIKFIISKGYFVYADTYINTIFVKEEHWENNS